MIMLRLLGLLVATILVNAQPVISATATTTTKATFWPIYYFIGAAACGNSEAIQRCLADGMDVNAQDQAGKTALRVAVKNNQQAIMKLLVEAGANINEETPCPLLYDLATDNNITGMEILLASKKYVLDVNITEPTGYTALHHAAEKDFSNIVAWLLDHGALPRKAHSTGLIPLHLAAMHGSVASCWHLLVADPTTITVKPTIPEWCSYNATELAKKNNHLDVLAVLEQFRHVYPDSDKDKRCKATAEEYAALVGVLILPETRRLAMVAPTSAPVPPQAPAPAGKLTSRAASRASAFTPVVVPRATPVDPSLAPKSDSYSGADSDTSPEPNAIRQQLGCTIA